MVNMNSQQSSRRSRWHGYFEQILFGPDSEVEAATDAAMRAIASGAGRDAIIAAGKAAAKAERARREQPYSNLPPGLQQQPVPPRRRQSNSAGEMTSQSRSSSEQSAGDARPSRIWPANSAVVHLLEKRSESLDGQFFQVWSMRLFRLEDGWRPVPPPIPVEMRGRSIIGQLNKGDVVEIPYGRSGHTRMVKTLRNLSTECEIEAKGRPFRRFRTLRRTSKLVRSTVSTLFALAVLVGIGVAVYYALHYGVGDIHLP
jgi:hypothetical protein